MKHDKPELQLQLQHFEPQRATIGELVGDEVCAAVRDAYLRRGRKVTTVFLRDEADAPPVPKIDA